jgi:hypothetical protein
MLLSRDVKEDRRTLAIVVGLILLTRFLDILWWIEPAFGGGLPWYGLLDVAALLGLGGIWVWWFLRQLRRRPLLPLQGPGLEGEDAS